MAEDDIDVVRRAWAATGRADLDGFRAELHPEILTIPFGAAMEGKSYEGPDAVVGWLRDEILATWEFFEVLPERFERVGDKLLVTGRWHARGAESGVELNIPATWVIEVRDGKIAYWQTYTEHAQARHDIGLED